MDEWRSPLTPADCVLLQKTQGDELNWGICSIKSSLLCQQQIVMLTLSSVKQIQMYNLYKQQQLV